MPHILEKTFERDVNGPPIPSHHLLEKGKSI